MQIHQFTKFVLVNIKREVLVPTPVLTTGKISHLVVQFRHHLSQNENCMKTTNLEFWSDSFHESFWACEELSKIFTLNGITYEKGFCFYYINLLYY